ncbi:hypothetical protein [Phocaeicola coprocola]|uniref:hypothetical protein n=1 Tax=Phocaeicola coprocola TaxID=310298 RepID=UPI00241C4FF9|nr:hypothetical protein [Phocaeicola coprocola]
MLQLLIMFHPIQAKITDEKKNVKEKNAEKKEIVRLNNKEQLQILPINKLTNQKLVLSNRSRKETSKPTIARADRDERITMR